VVDNTIIKRKKLIRCTAAQKITTYYNIYKTDCPHSYTVTAEFVLNVKVAVGKNFR